MNAPSLNVIGLLVLLLAVVGAVTALAVDRVLSSTDVMGVFAFVLGGGATFGGVHLGLNNSPTSTPAPPAPPAA